MQRTRTALLAAACGVLWLSAVRGQEPLRITPPVLRNAFPTSSTPAGVVLTPATRAALRKDPAATDVTSVLSEDANSRSLVYFVFSAPSEGDMDCQRCGRHEGFGHEDPFRMEISLEWATAKLGTAETKKAIWVQAHPNIDLAAFQIKYLSGPAVVGAFRPEDARAGQYVVLYRQKRWPDATDREAGIVTCIAHTHQTGTFAVIPNLQPVAALR
jgi:hypothetical protein